MANQVGELLERIRRVGFGDLAHVGAYPSGDRSSGTASITVQFGAGGAGWAFESTLDRKILVALTLAVELLDGLLSAAGLHEFAKCITLLTMQTY